MAGRDNIILNEAHQRPMEAKDEKPQIVLALTSGTSWVCHESPMLRMKTY